MVKSKPQAKFFPVMSTPMLPKGTFNGKTALITGGGTGIGKGISLVLSTLGASVAIFGRRLKQLESTAKEISDQTGNKVFPCQCDVRDAEVVKNAINQVEKELGLPTLIVNNAAGNFASPFERLSPNAIKTIVDIVLMGTFNITLDVGKRIIAAKTGGAFVNITTTYTLRGSGFVVPSGAAKAGVENLARGLASEWGRYGIRLNCIAPGPVQTEGAASRLDPDEKFRDYVLNKLPIGRVGATEEIGNMASYLLSGYSNFMTGATILMDGGETVFSCGEFNHLMYAVKEEQWDAMEKIIRDSNKKSKGN